MKINTSATLISLLLLFVQATGSFAQSVGINDDGSTPDNSAILDLKSTEKGFLPPRMTEDEMIAIPSPVFGLTVMCTDCLPPGPYYYDGTAWVGYATNLMSFSDVTSLTGKTWMDRNLGASRVAQSSTDAMAYGYLYQWGRGNDGHQIRTSPTTTTLSTTDSPGNGDFIVVPEGNFYDWRSGHNNNLWQGADGINNPCPEGYRLPTSTEWEAERNAWSSQNAAGAFASPLKLPMARFRQSSNGVIYTAEDIGNYWSSTAELSQYRAYLLIFLENGSSPANSASERRATGASVRCIKDD